MLRYTGKCASNATSARRIAAKRDIARLRPHPRNAMQRRSRCIKLRRERSRPARRAAPPIPRCRIRPGRPLIECQSSAQRRRTRGVVQQRVDLIHEVVAAGAIDLPIVRQHAHRHPGSFSTTSQARRSRRTCLASARTSADNSPADRQGHRRDRRARHRSGPRGTAEATSRASPRIPPHPRCAARPGR